MKPMRYISLIIALLSVLGLAAQQQQSQYALYNYRNDGDFNAWLNIDVDSITYSNIGLDSVEYDNIVTQEVWTPDSCYRIPIEVIDSIGFRAPAPEYQDNVFHITTEHLPYITAVDSLTITFYSTLPVLMRPTVGQVVTSDTFEEPLTEGFAGKVLEINDDGEHVTIICEGANVTDVFKRLVLVGKGVGVNEEEAKSRPLRKPRKIWGDYENYDNIEFEFPGKVSVKIGDFISIEDHVSMSADYYIFVDLPRFKMRATATGTHNLKTSWSIDSDKILEWMGLERDKFEPDWATPFWPVVAIPGVFSFGVKLGGFLDPSVKLSLTGSTPITFTHTFGVEFSNTDTHVMFPMVIPIANVHSELGTPEISLSLEGKLFAGIALGLKTKLIADNVVHGDITGRFGPEFDAKIQMKQTLGEGDPISWYSLLKDSKVGVQIKADAKVKAKVFGKNMTENLAWDWKWPIPGWELTRYLFPDFTKPELPHYLMPEPLDMTTTPHKDIIMPIYAGLGIYDEEGTQQRAYYSGELYRTDAYYKRIPHIYIGDLPAGQKFTCRPIFNIPSLPGIGEIKADPVTEFTVPEPMTLDISSPLNSVTLKKGQEAFYAINGGWGDYSVSSSAETLCSASLVTIDDKPYVKLVASKYMEDSAVITVKDLRPGTTETIFVTVSGEMTLVTGITLSQTTVNMQPSGTVTLTATVLPEDADNKTLAWESSNESVAMVSTGGIVTAIGEGSCVITCSAVDGSGVKAECQVTVTEQAATQTGETLNVVRETDLGYSPTFAHVDFSAAKTYLGVNEVTTDMLFIINPDNSEVPPEVWFPYDGWFNGDGSATRWGSSTNSMICVKFFNAITDGQFEICDMNGADKVGKTYTTRWALKANGKTYTYTINVTFVEDLPHEYVDLGLPSGTLWATCNVGANSPEEYGDYFAWGETAPKDYYDWSTYKWYNGSYDTMTKYCIHTEYDGDNGFTDGKTELDPEDDAAAVNWGGSWRMPTFEQMRELLDNCTREWTTQGGVNGILVTGPNGSTIFLPAAGGRWYDELDYAGAEGYYWSRSLETDSSDYAWILFFSSLGWYLPSSDRSIGLSVRPVRVQN